MNEFVSAGVDAALLFWLIDETGVCGHSANVVINAII